MFRAIIEQSRDWNVERDANKSHEVNVLELASCTRVKSKKSRQTVYAIDFFAGRGIVVDNFVDNFFSSAVTSLLRVKFPAMILAELIENYLKNRWLCLSASGIRYSRSSHGKSPAKSVAVHKSMKLHAKTA